METVEITTRSGRPQVLDRFVQRYSHPPRVPLTELKLGYLRHIPPGSAITLA